MPYPTPPCLAPPRPTIPHHTPPAELPAQGDICETLLLELSQPRIGITTANAFAAVEGDIPSTAIERAACKGECKKATCVWARTASGSHADGRLRGMAKRAYEDGEDGVAQPQHHRAAPRSRPDPPAHVDYGVPDRPPAWAPAPFAAASHAAQPPPLLQPPEIVGAAAVLPGAPPAGLARDTPRSASVPTVLPTTAEGMLAPTASATPQSPPMPLPTHQPTDPPRPAGAGGMDTNTAGQAVVPGWTAPRSTTGEGVDAALRNHAVALANIVASVPAETPINIEALGTQLGTLWEGAERVIDILTAAGLARLAGETDQETVAFLAIPNPAYV